jgi:hypothetical protein
MDKSIANFNTRLRTIKIRELIVGLIAAGIISGILMIIFPVIDESDELFMLVFLLAILAFFVYALKGTTGLGKNFQNLFEDENKKEILYVFALNILFACLFMFLISALDILMGLGDPTWISIWDIDTVDVSYGIVWYDVVTAIIFAPIIEELVFRGVLFNRLKIRTGIVPSMLITSFLFAIGHDFGGMTSAFLFGICMCILYLKTDNILIPMSVHFINNVVATIMEITQVDIFLAQWPWIVPSLIITIIGTYFLVKYIFQGIKKLKKEYD